MRVGAGLAVAFLLLVPTAGAATQDALLSSFSAYGDDDLFDNYPALLYLKLAISNRLQTGALTQAELDELEVLLAHLTEIARLHGELRDPDAAEILLGLADLAVLRANLVQLDAPIVQPYRELLNISATTLTSSFVLQAERQVSSQPSTAQRLTLLSAAVESAAAVQDGLAYSRLSLLLEELRQEYDADIARSVAQFNRGAALLATEASPRQLGFLRHYAALIEARDDLGATAATYDKHGEPRAASEATELQRRLDEKVGSMGLTIAGVLVAYILLIFLLGTLLLGRVLRWSMDQQSAGLGDELVVDV